MPNGTYGGVRGKETKIGRKKKTFVSLPTRFCNCPKSAPLDELVVTMFVLRW